MANNELKLEIPQDIITSIVKAQVIASLGKSEELIAGVVQQAITQKRNHYDKTTIFEEQVSEMIRGVAVECFKEWLAENREKVRAEMRKQLTAQKGKLITDLVDGFTKKLTNIYPTVALQFGDH
ncbi:MAG: hypothetical protein ACOZQL_10500 [Myxococcota bacterium]